MLGKDSLHGVDGICDFWGLRLSRSGLLLLLHLLLLLVHFLLLSYRLLHQILRVAKCLDIALMVLLILMGIEEYSVVCLHIMKGPLPLIKLIELVKVILFVFLLG